MNAQENFPPELNQPLLRRVRMSDSFKRSWLIFSLALLGMFFLMAGMGYVNARKTEILRERGVTVRAVIYQMWVSHGKSTYYHVGYAFQPVSDTSTIQDSTTVPYSEYQQLHVQEIVPVVYDPQDVQRSMLNFSDVVHTRDPYAAFYFLMKFSLILCGSMYLIVLPFLWWNYNKDKKLVMGGSVARAKITGEEDYSDRSGSYMRVTYEFTDNNGVLVTGTRNALPRRTSQKEKSRALLEKIFTNTVVLYDPEKSSRNTLYPAVNADCVPAD